MLFKIKIKELVMENSSSREPTSVGGWIVTFILLSIPIVNIIMLIIWLIGDTEPSKKNFLIASIVYALLVAVLFMLFGAGLVGLAA